MNQEHMDSLKQLIQTQADLIGYLKQEIERLKALQIVLTPIPVGPGGSAPLPAAPPNQIIPPWPLLPNPISPWPGLLPGTPYVITTSTGEPWDIITATPIGIRSVPLADEIRTAIQTFTPMATNSDVSKQTLITNPDN